MILEHFLSDYLMLLVQLRRFINMNEIPIHTNFGKTKGFSNARQFVYANCRSGTKSQVNPKSQYYQIWDFVFGIFSRF